jgi:hypothetical protein
VTFIEKWGEGEILAKMCLMKSGGRNFDKNVL